jgi:transcriptional regulator with XRE-family HTH domain
MAKPGRLDPEQLRYNLHTLFRHSAPLADGLRADAARHSDALRRAPLLNNRSPHVISHVLALTKRKRLAQAQSKRTFCPESAYRSDMANRPKTPVAIAFGLRIKQAREEKGWSQAKLAANIGVTNGAVGAWEIGIKSPRHALASKLAEALGVPMEWLLTGNEPEEQRKAQTHAELEILKLTRELSPEQQASALAMLRGLAATDPKKK